MGKVEVAQPSELEEVAAFYKHCGYGGGVSERETTLVLRVGGQLIGAVRLCPEEGYVVLRGMQVHPAFQRQGVGYRLLSACVPFLEKRQRSFCLPYTHLVSFYEKAGFSEVPSTELPAFLSARLSSYLARGQQVLAMARVTPNPSIEQTAAGKPASAAHVER